MLLPTKLVSFNESILNKTLWILEAEFIEISLVDLFNHLSKKFEDPNEFMLAIDLLWVLELVEVDQISGVVKKC